MKKLVVFFLVVGLILVSSEFTFSNEHKCSLKKGDDYVLNLYTGGAPWEPQINFIYKDKIMVFVYEYNREVDEKTHREDLKKVSKVVSPEEANRIINILNETNFFKLRSKYINKSIADGIEIIIKIETEQCEKEVYVQNYYVNPVIKIVEFINDFSPPDIKLLIPDHKRGYPVWVENDKSK